MQKTSLFTTKMLTRIGGLVGLSVVLKTYLSLTDGPNWRFTLFGIPLVIIGLMYRPHIAIISGFIVDFIYVMLSPFSFGFNLMTMESISFALIPSLLILLIGYENVKTRHLVLSISLAFIIGFFFNSLQLYIWSGTAMYAYIPIRLVFLIANIVINTLIAPVIYERIILEDLKLDKIIVK